jgi:CHAT domain-containing protein
MDETRDRAYLQLIHTLLTCPNGEENQILNANSELVDAELVQMMRVIAAQFSENNQENAGSFLLQTATQIANFLGMNDDGDSDNSESEDSQEYVNFILQLLQAEQDSHSDIQVIYPMLAGRQDLLNLRFAETLQQVADNLIAQHPEAIYDILTLIANLSIDIYQFPRGNRAKNIEITITGYQIVLNNRQPGSEEYAGTQNNLAAAYSDRINGSRADNLERAIEFYHAALTVRNRKNFPEQWAATQNNLAIAYSDRINGSRADNLERAIEFYHAALTVYTLEDFPEKSAMTQNNLALAYSNRINGLRADNLERAIEFYHAALTVLTPDDFPEDWAMNQNNLAIAYSDRINGSRADNLERAIEFYHAALTVLATEDFREKWAATQNNLALAYSDRIDGSRADNLERAIEFYHAALTVLTPDDFYEKWATTQNNLALAYSNRINGSRADNLERAIEFYHAALTIRTREAFPQDYTETLFNLGNLYQNNQQWQLAYDTYTPAIETVEFLRGEIESGDETKQKLAEEYNRIYSGMVEICIELQRYTEAIEYVERSKARNLVELFANRDIKPKGNIPETVLNELSRLSREIEAEQRRLEIEQINRNSNGGIILRERSLQIDSLTTSRDSTHLTKLRKQLDELIAREITPIDPDFSLTQKVKPILYKDIQTLTGENTAILEWYIAGDKFFTFIITPQTPTPIIWQSSTANFEALVNWYDEYRKDYEESKPPERKPQWQEKLASRLQNLAEILQLDRILENIPKQCDRLILIPHRFLHLFPLHALPISHERDVERGCTDEQNSAITVSLSKSELCFLDLFPGGVSYAPSCQLLQQAKQRQRPNFSHLFAIANPTKDRYLLELQAANICEKFKSNDFLAKDDANKNAILNAKLNFANCAHFGCHGKFEPDSPLESSLVFANKERLTLLEILNLDLNQCRLVTLSACETGLTKSKTSDEYIGLPFGFLLAGSPSIVSTLWEVDQVTSTLLLMRFYENLESMSTVTALNEAQQWLRNMTSEGLEALLKDLKPQIDEIFDQLPLMERTRYVQAPLNGAKNRKPFPFVEPHYWSGFIAIGV